MWLVDIRRNTKDGISNTLIPFQTNLRIKYGCAIDSRTKSTRKRYSHNPNRNQASGIRIKVIPLASGRIPHASPNIHTKIPGMIKTRFDRIFVSFQPDNDSRSSMAESEVKFESCLSLLLVRARRMWDVVDGNVIKDRIIPFKRPYYIEHQTKLKHTKSPGPNSCFLLLLPLRTRYLKTLTRHDAATPLYPIYT